MDDLKQQVVDRLKKANNILVTVSNNPSVDLLSACIGLALVLDKMEKHAAAVFSGNVPSAMEFLKPEETIERTPDSLRDFIIALDKSKADKLRYKVEDKVVRIFITPYKTSLSQEDLEFSQGDFNVDVVVALGVHEQQELDQAITTHGRILHDAAVISINNTPNGNLGSINWQEVGVSSISEMVAALVKELGKDILDEQISTALLTGIVAETVRFSNDKTTPQTMNVAGDLMAAGANQQLVATSLQATDPMPQSSSIRSAIVTDAAVSSSSDDGTLEIDHQAMDELAGKETEEPDTHAGPVAPRPVVQASSASMAPARELLPSPEPPHITNVHGSPQSALQETPFTAEYGDDGPTSVRSYLVDEPVLPDTVGGRPAANHNEPSQANPLEVPPAEVAAPLIPHGDTIAPILPSAQEPALTSTFMPEPPASPSSLQLPPPIVPSTVPTSEPVATSPAVNSSRPQTLKEIEESVHSPHVGQSADTQAQEVDAARNQVFDALQHSATPRLEPLQSVGANFLSAQLHPPEETATLPSSSPTPNTNLGIKVDADGNLTQAMAVQPVDQITNILPSPMQPQDSSISSISTPNFLPGSAPPVPPPILPQ